MNTPPPTALILPFAALLVLAGCATSEARPRRSVYGSISLPPDAATIGLTVARPCPEFALQLPVDKGSAARSVAAAGAQASVADPQAALFFPAGYALGGIVGCVFGVNEGELRTATLSVHGAAQELYFAERLAQAIREHVNATRPGRIRDLEDNLPLEPRPEPGRLRRTTGKQLNWTRPPPAPHPLAGSDVDTVIGIRVAFQGFQARPNPNVRSTGDLEHLNPPLTLVLTADVSASRVRDWASHGGLTVSYESPPRKFTEWAAGDAAPLRRECEAGLQEILRLVTMHVGSGRQPPKAYE